MEGIRCVAALLGWIASLLLIWVIVRHHMTLAVLPLSWTIMVAAFYTVRILFPDYGDVYFLNTWSAATTVQGLFLCIGAVIIWRIKPWTRCHS